MFPIVFIKVEAKFVNFPIDGLVNSFDYCCFDTHPYLFQRYLVTRFLV